jgi:hypothetical protein
VEVKSGFQGMTAVFWFPVAGLGDEHNFFPESSPETAGYLVAIQFGQANVNQYDVGFPGQSLFNSFDAILSHPDLVAHNFKQSLQCFPAIEIVFDDEDSQGAPDGEILRTW